MRVFLRQSRRWNQRIDTVLIVPGQAARLSRPRRPAIRTTDGHRKNLNKIVFKNKQLQYLLRGLLGALALTSALVAAQTPTADECRQKHVNDPVAQVICARQAYLAAPASEAQPASPLTSPLANTQVIFGFYDRRFPGFNNGLEHLGVDFSTAAGAAVAAICDGTVVFNNTSQASIGAAVVMVEHDCPQPLGTVYGYYGHVQSVLLTGENVAAGTNIGFVRDWGGNSHLHLGLSTRLYEADWGVVPRGATLQELEAQGWLNPLNYFSGIQPRPAASYVAQPVARPQPPVRNVRTIVPLRPLGKLVMGTVKLKRVR